MPLNLTDLAAARQRIAGEHVERCCNGVRLAVERLHCSGGVETLDEALFRAVAFMLRREIQRLKHHDLESRVLPASLHEEVGRWKASVTSRIEPVVRLRVSQWHVSVMEMLHRLNADWADIVTTFAIDPDARVSDISPPKGDFHNEGRSVYTVSFEDGSILVYKPRSVDGEYTFGRVVEWLQRECADTQLTACRVLVRTGYGWCGHIQTVFCRSTHEASLFYERQGAFLALFFLLCGSDCIGDNLVVAQDRPVWVDTECLCCPKMQSAGLAQQLPEWMRESVLSTLFVFAGNEVGWPARENTGLAVSCFEHEAEAFDARGILSDRYVAAVTAGFQRLYGWVLSNRTAWCETLPWWQGQRLRLIARPTWLYISLAEALLVAPPDAGNAVREAVAEVLTSATKAAWQNHLVSVEMQALERGNVPFWVTTPTSCGLQEASGLAVSDVAERSGMQCLWERAAQLSDDQQANQTWLIETFLRAHDGM